MNNSKSIVNKNLQLLQNMRSDYYAPLIDSYDDIPPKNPDESLYNNTTKETPQTIQYYIDHDNGKVVITGKRYLRLGKIQLYDSLKDAHFDNEKYISILDTHTQILHCFNIKELYNNFIVKDKTSTATRYGSFDLTESTKSIVLGEIFK